MRAARAIVTAQVAVERTLARVDASFGRPVRRRRLGDQLEVARGELRRLHAAQEDRRPRATTPAQPLRGRVQRRRPPGCFVHHTRNAQSEHDRHRGGGQSTTRASPSPIAPQSATSRGGCERSRAALSCDVSPRRLRRPKCRFLRSAVELLPARPCCGSPAVPQGRYRRALPHRRRDRARCPHRLGAALRDTSPRSPRSGGRSASWRMRGGGGQVRPVHVGANAPDPADAGCRRLHSASVPDDA